MRLSPALDRRTHDWMAGNFRRLTMRYDPLQATYGGFFHLACALLVLSRVLDDFEPSPCPKKPGPTLRERSHQGCQLDGVQPRPRLPPGRLPSRPTPGESR